MYPSKNEKVYSPQSADFLNEDYNTKLVAGREGPVESWPPGTSLTSRPLYPPATLSWPAVLGAGWRE